MFVRTAIGNQLELSFEPVSESTWRVGLKWRPTVELGALEAVPVPVDLGGLGKSCDGETLDLTTEEMLSTLPRVMEECILPTIERAPA